MPGPIRIFDQKLFRLFEVGDAGAGRATPGDQLQAMGFKPDPRPEPSSIAVPRCLQRASRQQSIGLVSIRSAAMA